MPTTKDYCIPQCKKGKNDEDQIRCCVCARWFHNSCINITQNEADGIWPCFSCRLIPSKVDKLQVCMDQLFEVTKTILNKICDQSPVLNSLECMKNDITGISQNLQVLKQATSEPKPGEQQRVNDKKYFIIGDSLVKDFRTKSNDMKIKTLRGKTYCDVTQTLSENSGHHENLFIVIGTNSCTNETNIDEIKKEMQEMVKVAKEKADNVTLASIPPKNDLDGNMDEIVKQVNAIASDLCEQEDVTFVDNDKNFRYRNGESDKDLLNEDGLHLSQKGASRLISNLGLHDFVKVTETSKYNNHGSTTKNPRSDNEEISTPNDNVQYFRGHKSELSNFYPCNLQMYNRNFTSSEAAFQYATALEHGKNKKAEEIRQAPNAHKAKQLAKNIEQTEQWQNKKSDIMWEILEQKARHCEKFRRKLIETGDDTLIEDTNDDYWGRGSNGNGKNMLGTLLMLLRQKLLLKPERTTFHSKRCTNCGEDNHTKEDCGFRREIKCYRCNTYGHKQKFCSQFSEW